MRTAQSFALLIAGAALLSACSSTPVNLEAKPVVEDRSANTNAAADSRSVQSVNAGPMDPLKDPAGVLAKRSVYFDYDSNSLREDAKPVVTAHGAYLSKNKDRKIIIQGNTDERGGREYNLALGQKRAEALRKSLAAVGVSENQMEAVSLGKEKPKATGSDEAAWAENRRADIVY